MTEKTQYVNKEIIKEIFKDLEKNVMSSTVGSHFEHGIRIMESTYQNIKKKFLEDTYYSYDDIREIILKELISVSEVK